MRRMSKSKAFTLIELLIVMAIIGLLSIAAIAGGSYAIKQGRTSRKRKEVDQMATLLQAYYNQNLQYPAPQATAIDVAGLVTTQAKLGQFAEGYKFEEKPCMTAGCFAYTTTDSNTLYSLCVQVDPGTPTSQYNTPYPATGTPTKLCYCIGGATSATHTSNCDSTTKYSN